MSDETLAERVKRFRERTGLNQSDFAEKAGISKDGLQKIERGLTERPDVQTIVGISLAAGRPVIELSGLMDPPWAPLDELGNDLEDVIRREPRLDEERRDALLTIVRTMLSEKEERKRS